MSVVPFISFEDTRALPSLTRPATVTRAPANTINELLGQLTGAVGGASDLVREINTFGDADPIPASQNQFPESTLYQQFREFAERERNNLRSGSLSGNSVALIGGGALLLGTLVYLIAKK